MSNCLFYECLFFFRFFFSIFFPFSFLFFFFFFSFSFPPQAGSEELGAQGCVRQGSGHQASSARPLRGRRWPRCHPWMGAGNRAALGKRLGRWFHLAAPLISLLEGVEVFNVISLSSSTRTPFEMAFFSRARTHFHGGPLLGTNKNFTIFFPPVLVCSPSRRLIFSTEKKEELLE